MHRLAKLFLLVCCGWLLTGPLLLLQLGAWSWMLASYSQQSRFEQAIVETFGGTRPCEMCKFINTVDAEPTTAPATEFSDNKSFKLIFEKVAKLCLTPRFYQNKYPYRTKDLRASHQCEVPTPPPRVV